MHQFFHPTAAHQFRPHSLRAARNFLNRILTYPKDILGNIRQYVDSISLTIRYSHSFAVPRSLAGETILSIAYGIQVQQEHDFYIETAEKGSLALVTAGVPGTYLVDMLPFLKYVPEWMPGAGFQKKAKIWRRYSRDMIELPFEAAKKSIVQMFGNQLITSADCHFFRSRAPVRRVSRR